MRRYDKHHPIDRKAMRRWLKTCLSYPQIAKKVGCSAGTVSQIARELGVKRRAIFGRKGCLVIGCAGKHYAKGYCHAHHEYLRRTGKPLYAVYGSCRICGKVFKKPKQLNLCPKHRDLRNGRMRKNLPYDDNFLKVKLSNKGKRNGMWKGGVFEYKNHYTMKQNRLLRLEQAKYKCEAIVGTSQCGKRANRIYHMNKDKQDHSLGNLGVVCNKHFGENAIAKQQGVIRC